MADARRVGDYVLEAELGAGAVGAVYRARAADGRLVAVKQLRAELAGDDAFRRRFEHEARAAQAVSDRHLVTVLEHGEDDGRPYLVLEHVGGGSLSARLEHGALPLDEAVRLITEIAAGLDALHAAGIVHRDVKPSNVMLREDGSAALTDFGLAKGAAYTVLTRPGQVLGTLDYLAPELVRGEPATPASDLYALGCVTFECLAGKPPFADRSLFGIGTAHLHDEPPDPGFPPEVMWAVRKALEKDPAARPPTATAFAHLLRAAAEY